MRTADMRIEIRKTLWSHVFFFIAPKLWRLGLLSPERGARIFRMFPSYRLRLAK